MEDESLPEILQQRVRKERLERNKEASRKAVDGEGIDGEEVGHGDSAGDQCAAC